MLFELPKLIEIEVICVSGGSCGLSLAKNVRNGANSLQIGGSEVTWNHEACLGDVGIDNFCWTSQCSNDLPKAVVVFHSSHGSSC